MAIVFVHGVNVRRKGFELLKRRVQQGVAARRQGTRVHCLYWGDLGASLQMAGASIPGFVEGSRAVDAGEEEVATDGNVALLLLENPEIELASLRDQEDFDPTGAGFQPMPPLVEQRNEVLERARPRVAEALATAEVLSTALSNPDLRGVETMVTAAFRAAGKADRALSIADLIDPLTRAVTASMFRQIENQALALSPTLSWTEIEAVIAGILETELGSQRGWIGDKLRHGPLRLVTGALRLGLRRRIMNSLSLFMGDLLVYLSNRKEIQARLERTIDAALDTAGGPLTLIAHSLGGLITFEHVVETGRRVERFLTVGSQPGLFAELGVLNRPLTPDANRFTTPEPIEEWVNVYDPDDVLSFLVEPIFDRGRDVELNTRAPFPVAHSEYWARSELYEILLP